MKFSVVELAKFSKGAAKIYSVILESETVTLFDKFINENLATSPIELKSIRDRLLAMGQNKKVGAKYTFFKHDEGNLGDGVCALFDIPESNLRLYCIRYGATAIILGSGGLKPKSTRAYQETPKLDYEAGILKRISEIITKYTTDPHSGISWNEAGELVGNLNFDEDEY